MIMKTATERYEWGRSRREVTSLDSLADTGARASRDPVGLITGQEASRLQFLIPLRHERMGASVFSFYRGSAVVQAADLAHTGNTGIDVQICGDAHLSNFGLYASPERRLMFDMNDFDETLPGPFEWDVKRLAASFVLAGRDLGHAETTNEKTVRAAVKVYRQTVAEFSRARYIDAWMARSDAEALGERVLAPETKGAKSTPKLLDKARSRDCLRALTKLAIEVDGHYRLKSDPPNLVPLRELAPDRKPREIRELVNAAFEGYQESLPDSIATLTGRYQLVDVALKVVGVGSVGTRCFVALFKGRDREDPLFLQIKQAGKSVLEEYLPPSRYDHSGRRVVEGQRLMQAASDSFLGWTQDPGGKSDYYVRQMWDMKGSVDVAALGPKALREYAMSCGWTLARAHCRSGSASAISGYLGNGHEFDRAIARFAAAYADLAEADFATFKSALPLSEADRSINSGMEVRREQ